MPNPEHLAKLMEGVEAWNEWRRSNRSIVPDFSGVNLPRADLHEANLIGADFSGADLSAANLYKANLGAANLSGANLMGANLSAANLYKANLSAATLMGAYLIKANLRVANLSGADLYSAALVDTNLEFADLTGCRVYGISVWSAKLYRARQSNLIITPYDEPTLQVDNLEVAQFIYLLLNNERIRSVIDTITSKVVLILGRFTPERIVVLDAIRDELRGRDYLPVLFTFEKPDSKSLTGTVLTLANMPRFIIADLTDPSSVPYELGRVVPNTRVPVQTILLKGQREFAMFVDLKKDYGWVLEPYQYKSKELLIANLNERVIAPAEAKAEELRRK